MAIIGDASQGLPLPLPLPEGGQVQGPRAGWRLALSSFVENKLAVVGVAIVVLFLAFCFLGPFVYHTNQLQTDVLDAYLSPGKGHPLGTDSNGFDELGRMMKGGQSALEIGLFSSLIATVIGTLVGAIAGLVGGFVDAILMRLVDVLLSIPLLFVILIVSAHYGASVIRLSLIIGAFSWLVSARLVRGEVLSLRVRDFVLAARTMGATRNRLIYKHLIPNALGVVIVNITFQVADSINFLAILGFLGFGLNYPQVDWGDMLSNALNSLQDGYWWLVYPVGICLVVVVMAFNFIGDALRDTVDVRLRRR
ncbi:MAG TPA: ABC transporter permease [Acidimicrobiales bacterium]|jgi:peptide/nickel transport system permease protein|nr:ABC transporter permease [Acidimicrobiales bacterium]